MKFSVCIPNFNYEVYIGKTIQSVLNQTYQDFEILISDNASTDSSVEIIKSFNDPRIKFQINKINIGFGPNLLKAASMASGDYMLMLSSDDLMLPNALETYRQILQSLDEERNKVILCSKAKIINEYDQQINYLEIDQKLWNQANNEEKLTELINNSVYSLSAETLLRFSFLLMRNPFHFLTTLYPKCLHDQVESYYHGSLINPDKRFGWELLGVAEKAYFVDEALFSYRIHNNNQGSQQAKMGAIKHHIDEYVATINVQESLLKKASITRQELIDAFIEQDIALRGLKFLGEGNSLLARRILHFGLATYPKSINKNTKAKLLRVLLLSGFIGQFISQKLMTVGLSYWNNQTQKTLQKLNN
ncbi:glycosyltransferase family 2 protein [Synechocystis sp. LKSZ1]|uniref:glycosyltransferase family 2 protein n=1 Tax=Synechocystis sp. LKSZ1 TaxID=3144951 RepID=UPI00336C268C